MSHSDAHEYEHDLDLDDPILYAVYVPAGLLGIMLCFYGFQLSRKTRAIFGFSAGFYGMYFGAPRWLSTAWEEGAHEWALLFFSVICGLILGKISSIYYQFGLFLIGTVFGFALGYNLVNVGTYKLWCGEHLAGYCPFQTCMALLFGWILYRAERKLRRQLVMFYTAFVGSFTLIQSSDVFAGNYLDYDDVKFRTLHCLDPPDVLWKYAIIEVVLFIFGLGTQQLLWKRKLRHMKNQNIDEEMTMNVVQRNTRRMSNAIHNVITINRAGQQYDAKK